MLTKFKSLAGECSRLRSLINVLRITKYEIKVLELIETEMIVTINAIRRTINATKN